MANLKTPKNLYAITFFLGALGVIFGAFGAHWLAERLAVQQLTSYKTAVLYHFIHVLAALSVLNLVTKGGNKGLTVSVFLFLGGILFFSGSLYLLATREILGLSYYKWLGPLTPIGGLLFIAGWINATMVSVKGSTDPS